MHLRKDGGTIMSKELNIDNDIKPWLPAIDNLLLGKKAQCPHCCNENIDFQAVDFGKGVGFIRATCENCGRSGYISRYQFPENAKNVVTITV